MSGRSRPPADLLRSSPEPPRRPRRPRSRRFDIAAALALTAVGVTAGVWLTQGGGDGGVPLPGLRGDASKEKTRLAWSVFPGDPAARGDGRDQELTAVSAAGSTVVVAGGDSDPQGDGKTGRALFIVSGDGGRTWKNATVQAPGPGAIPKWVTGSSAGWLSGADDGTIWTSTDGQSWMRRPQGAGDGFLPNDQILGVAGTPNGWVAIGITPSSGPLKATPLLWVSPDGTKWERRTPANFGMPVSDDTVALTKIASDGTVIRVDGVRMKHLEDDSPSRREISWTSDDGGKDWKVIEKSGNRKVPRPESAYSLLPGVPKATLPAGQSATASAQAGALTVFAGKTTGGTDTDPVLTVRDGAGQDTQVDLAQIPGVLAHDLTIAALGSSDSAGPSSSPSPSPAKPLQLAAGSRDGRPSVWTSDDGATWKRATLPDLPGRGRLTAVAHGSSGWVVAGQKLLYTSPDGIKWSKAASPSPASPRVAAGKAGYLVIDGTDTWFSKDLASWSKSGLGDGAVHAVAAHPKGFTVLGAVSGRPVTWNSADGKDWQPADLPSTTGTVVDRLVTRGDVLVAAGRAGDQPVVLRSDDGGVTWMQTPLPGPASVTVLTATDSGFFAAGTADSDVVTWKSDDGRKWDSTRPQGGGLSGAGHQQALTAAVLAGALTVIATSDAPDGLNPVIWRPGQN